MDYRTQKELLGESRLSALFSPLLANRWLWVEAIVIPVIGIALCWLASPEDPVLRQQGRVSVDLVRADTGRAALRGDGRASCRPACC